MADFEMTFGDVTQQGTTNLDFDDDERPNPIAQIDTDGGTRNARMEIGPGFYTAPVPDERIHCVEYEDALYGIGGTNAAALEKLSPQQGERGAYAVDSDGNVRAFLRLRSDGSLLLETYKIEGDDVKSAIALQLDTEGGITVQNEKATMTLAKDGAWSIENEAGNATLDKTGIFDVNNGNLQVLP